MQFSPPPPQRRGVTTPAFVVPPSHKKQLHTLWSLFCSCHCVSLVSRCHTPHISTVAPLSMLPRKRSHPTQEPQCPPAPGAEGGLAGSAWPGPGHPSQLALPSLANGPAACPHTLAIQRRPHLQAGVFVGGQTRGPGGRGERSVPGSRASPRRRRSVLSLGLRWLLSPPLGEADGNEQPQKHTFTARLLPCYYPPGGGSRQWRRR